MGYSISVDADSISFIRKLRHQPDELFGRRYSGYILFLIGSGDTEVFEWLQKNIWNLDSLTGEDVAYCVFSQPYRIRFLEEHKSEKRGDEDIRTLLLKDLRSKRVAHYVRDIDIISDEEAIAITYGTDIVARMFDVTNQLPCIIVLDAVPKRDFLTLPLKNGDLQNLLPTFRESVHNFIKDSNYSQYKYTIRKLDELQGYLKSSENKVKSYSYEETNPITEKTFAENLKVSRAFILEYEKVIKGEIALKTFLYGNIYKRKGWSPILEDTEVADAITIAKEKLPQLQTLRATYRRLSLYSTNYSWKLNQEERKRYENVCKKFVFEFVGDIKVDFDSKSDCDLMIMKLQEYYTNLIDEIMHRLPSEKIFDERIRVAVIKKRESELSSSRQNVEQYTNRIREVSLQIYGAEQPSLMKAFSETSTKNGMVAKSNQLVDMLKTYTNSWLKPEVLIEIGKIIFKLG